MRQLQEANLPSVRTTIPRLSRTDLKFTIKETEPLKDFYEKKGVLKTVIGQKELKDTTALTAKALGIED